MLQQSIASPNLREAKGLYKAASAHNKKFIITRVTPTVTKQCPEHAKYHAP